MFKITIFSDEKHEADDNPSPHPCTPCVHLKRPRVCRHHAHMCFNMCACCRYTRGRFGRTHTPHTSPHLKTQHNTTQLDHNTTRRQRKKRERKIERREKRKKTETEREEKTEDKRRQDKTKREERRDKRQEMKEKMKDKTREDERDKRREQNIKRSREPELNCLINYSPSGN